MRWQTGRQSTAHLNSIVRHHLSFLVDPFHRVLHRRIGRVGFLLGHAFVVGVALAFHRIFDFAPSHEPSVWFAAFMVVFWIVSSGCLTAWRCHDFGQGLLDTFWRDQIPIVGGVWALLELLLLPGDKMQNGYGDPPAF